MKKYHCTALLSTAMLATFLGGCGSPSRTQRKPATSYAVGNTSQIEIADDVAVMLVDTGGAAAVDLKSGKTLLTTKPLTYNMGGAIAAAPDHRSFYEHYNDNLRRRKLPDCSTMIDKKVGGKSYGGFGSFAFMAARGTSIFGIDSGAMVIEIDAKNLEMKRIIAPANPLMERASMLPALAVDHDGKNLAYSTLKELHVQTLGTGKSQSKTFPVATRSIAFSHDGKKLAVLTGKTFVGSTVYVLSMPTLKELGSFDAINGRRVRWSPDDNYIGVSDTSEEGIAVYPSKGSKNPKRYGDDRASVQDFVFSADGKQILAATTNGLRVFDR